MKKLLPVLLLLLWSVSVLAKNNVSSAASEELNIDYMLRGYFYAGSQIQDDNAFGFAPSGNYPKAILPSMHVPPGKLSLLVYPEEKTVFEQKYLGMKLLLVNATNEQLIFAASDSRLDIVQEALNTEGKWQAIEYLPSSGCGNSYHRVFLGNNEYWEFSAARFKGSFKTKLRFRLENALSEVSPTYSNEFDGYINPEQFNAKLDNEPTGLTDPYKD